MPSVFSPLVRAGDVRGAIKMAGELGYQGVEISLRAPSELDVRELGELLADYGVQLSALATGRVFLEDNLSLTDTDETRRGLAIGRIQEAIDYAAQFAAPVIIGLVRGIVGSGDRRAALELLAQGVRECADYGARKQTYLLVEPINRYETKLLNSAEETLALLDLIGRPNVKILLDCFHMNIEEVSMGDTVRRVGDRLGYFHIADSNRWAPGLGHIDYSDVVAALNDINYNGWLSAEILPLPDDFSAARQALNFVKRLRA